MNRALSLASAALPFAFGVIRAVKTGSDYRYLWVALAAGVGALVMGLSARRSPPISLTALVFIASGLTGVLAAMLLGTNLGPGILVVAASFAACFAAACLLHVIGITSMKGVRR